MDPQVQAFLNGLSEQELAALLARQGMSPEEYTPEVFPPAPPSDPGAIGGAPPATPDSLHTTWPGITQPPIGPIPQNIDALPEMISMADDDMEEELVEEGPAGDYDPLSSIRAPAAPAPYDPLSSIRVDPMVLDGLNERPAPRVTKSSSGNGGGATPVPFSPKPTKEFTDRIGPLGGFKARFREAWRTRGKDMQALAKSRMLKASRK